MMRMLFHTLIPVPLNYTTIRFTFAKRSCVACFWSAIPSFYFVFAKKVTMKKHIKERKRNKKRREETERTDARFTNVPLV